MTAATVSCSILSRRLWRYYASSKKTHSCARGSARRRDVQQKSCSLRPYAQRSSSSTCVDDDYSGHHRELPEQRKSMATKLLKKVLPTPLRPPIRAAALLLIRRLRRRLRHTWRSGVKRWVRGRRNRLKRRMRDTHNRLRRRVQRFLSDVWGRQLKQRIWPVIWRIHIWRKGSQPPEGNNQIHLISSLWSF